MALPEETSIFGTEFKIDGGPGLFDIQQTLLYGLDRNQYPADEERGVLFILFDMEGIKITAQAHIYRFQRKVQRFTEKRREKECELGGDVLLTFPGSKAKYLAYFVARYSPYTRIGVLKLLEKLPFDLFTDESTHL